MANFLILLAGLLLALHLYREYWARRSLPRVVNADFDGRLYRVGETVIAVREAAKNSDESILCFPGFLEDMRYFQHLYSGSSTMPTTIRRFPMMPLRRLTGPTIPTL